MTVGLILSLSETKFYATKSLFQPIMHTILSNNSQRARLEAASSENKEQVHPNSTDASFKQ